jgi:serine/threonine-protein kinase/endoribonuclease IRE1
LDVPDVLRQITAGVRHLHSLKIVHRDLKPQNILVATPRGRSGHPTLRLLISDFGLCKKLEDNQSSFRATTAHAAGTSGWRAPELLVDDQNPNPVLITDSQNTESSEPAVVDPQTNRRATRAIDIFSLGCVFYYVLTRGGHPYDKDGKFMREANIVKGNYNLTDLERLGDYAFEADDLIQQMLSLNPRRRLVSSFLLPPFSPFAFYLWTSFQFLSGWLTCRRFRPDATTVLIHPFFWSAADRLNFLCDVSDHFEFEPRDPPSSALLHLESVARDVMKPDQDFLKHLPKEFKDSLGKQRKYNGSRMLDLLRALRNKRNHYNDMPEHLKTLIGGLPDGYLQFWAVRFPSLLMNCHRVIAELDLCQVERFKRYFTPPD